MNDEELVNKAFQLNININELNKYTKPKAILKERNIFNSSLKDDENRDGKFEETGFVDSMYGMSKVHIMIYAKLLA